MAMASTTLIVTPPESFTAANATDIIDDAETEAREVGDPSALTNTVGPVATSLGQSSKRDVMTIVTDLLPVLLEFSADIQPAVLLDNLKSAMTLVELDADLITNAFDIILAALQSDAFEFTAEERIEILYSILAAVDEISASFDLRRLDVDSNDVSVRETVLAVTEDSLINVITFPGEELVFENSGYKALVRRVPMTSNFTTTMAGFTVAVSDDDIVYDVRVISKETLTAFGDSTNLSPSYPVVPVGPFVEVLTSVAGAPTTEINYPATVAFAKANLTALDAACTLCRYTCMKYDSVNLQWTLTDVNTVTTSDEVTCSLTTPGIVAVFSTYCGDGTESCYVPCGNGIIDAGEECDTIEDTDACKSCMVQPGYVCTGAPSTCTVDPVNACMAEVIPGINNVMCSECDITTPTICATCSDNTTVPLDYFCASLDLTALVIDFRLVLLY